MQTYTYVYTFLPNYPYILVYIYIYIYTCKNVYTYYNDGQSRRAARLPASLAAAIAATSVTRTIASERCGTRTLSVISFPDPPDFPTRLLLNPLTLRSP